MDSRSCSRPWKSQPAHGIFRKVRGHNYYYFYFYLFLRDFSWVSWMVLLAEVIVWTMLIMLWPNRSSRASLLIMKQWTWARNSLANNMRFWSKKPCKPMSKMRRTTLKEFKLDWKGKSFIAKFNNASIANLGRDERLENCLEYKVSSNMLVLRDLPPDLPLAVFAPMSHLNMTFI